MRSASDWPSFISCGAVSAAESTSLLHPGGTGSGQDGTRERLTILSKSNDGFFIASEDLKLRGPGDIFGLRQSGDLEFKLADIFTDANILKTVSEEVNRLLDEDPELSSEDHAELAKNSICIWKKVMTS